MTQRRPVALSSGAGGQERSRLGEWARRSGAQRSGMGPAGTLRPIAVAVHGPWAGDRGRLRVATLAAQARAARSLVDGGVDCEQGERTAVRAV